MIMNLNLSAVMNKKSKPIRTTIHCSLYCLTWFAQRGGEEQDALNWYAKKMKAEPYKLSSTDFKLGSFTYLVAERDALFWFKNTAGTGVVIHEVMHSMVRLATLLEVKIGEKTDEVFAYYAGWLGERLVRDLWYKGK